MHPQVLSRFLLIVPVLRIDEMFYSRDKTVQRLLDFNPKENGFVCGAVRCWLCACRPSSAHRP